MSAPPPTEEVYREEWYRRQRDIVYYVFALYLLRRAVEIAVRRVPGAKKALRRSLATYETTLPSVAQLRDVLTHFDEYDFGEGKRKPMPNAPSPTMWWGEDDAGLSYEDLRLSLSEATPVAKRLYETVAAFLTPRAGRYGGSQSYGLLELDEFSDGNSGCGLGSSKPATSQQAPSPSQHDLRPSAEGSEPGDCTYEQALSSRQQPACAVAIVGRQQPSPRQLSTPRRERLQR